MKKTITIIEDEPFIIEALSFILEKEGFMVKSISDGAKAIEFVKHTNPDLVILDIMLPNVSGMKILEDIRSTKLIAELPVLMLTAKGQKKDRRAAEDAGVNEFMTKPFDNAELIQQIKHMLKL
ncbi:response regulator [Amylibacter sp.]|nr:response regulator [Amylibacter sp.]MDB9784897.1 response regulator [Amylibacter sp.]MDB9816435.1 response regulator [Amylibacter sp.]MDB9878750.1 response regulator [Amylibacter sp.]MDC1247408.1 response regulator [Amylibacter sp.]